MTTEPTKPPHLRPGAAEPARSPVDGRTLAGAGPAARCWREADGTHVDVRGLPPPQPLVSILRLVRAQGDAAGAVIVHHDRDPVLLYPELAELGWRAERIAGEPGEVRLRLSKAGD